LSKSTVTSYIVAATPRTGSNLLCGGLIKSQVAGNPEEYFEPGSEAKWRAAVGVSMDESYEHFVEAAKRYGARDDMYGMKIHWWHVADLARNAGFRGRPEDVLEHYFPGALYVDIVRRDRLAQALSWFRAIETNEWFRLAGSAPPVEPPRLNPNAVRALMLNIERQQSEWMRYFQERGISALTVEYEELVSDRRGQIGRVLAFLGRDPAAAEIPDPQLIRQADEVTDHWRDTMQRALDDPTDLGDFMRWMQQVGQGGE
jgi:trehalose 2-sulfotransferase